MSYYTHLTPIDQKIYPIGEKDRQLYFSRIFRYTSLAYLKKIEEHFVLLCGAYELFVKKKGFNTHRRALLEGMLSHLSDLQDGLQLLQKGDLTGYADCFGSFYVIDFFGNRRFSDSYVMEEMGQRYAPKQSVGLYRLVEKLFGMMRQSAGCAWGHGGFSPDFPISLSEVPYMNGQLPPLPPPQSTPIPTNTPVPVSGIYLALHEYGYPSYFAQGMWTREANVPDELELNYKAYSDFKDKKPPIETRTYMKEVPVEWVLLWKDDRYRGGKIPDESHFIDETCELPTYSLAPPPLTDDD